MNKILFFIVLIIGCFYLPQVLAFTDVSLETKIVNETKNNVFVCRMRTYTYYNVDFYRNDTREVCNGRYTLRPGSEVYIPFSEVYQKIEGNQRGGDRVFDNDIARDEDSAQIRFVKLSIWTERSLHGGNHIATLKGSVPITPTVDTVNDVRVQYYSPCCYSYSLDTSKSCYSYSLDTSKSFRIDTKSWSSSQKNIPASWTITVFDNPILENKNS